MALDVPQELMSSSLRSLLVVTAAITVDLLFWDGEARLISGGQVPLWLPVSVTVAAHTALFWRRSRPLAVFGVQVAFAMVTLLVPLWQPVAGLLIATFAVAANSPAATARWGWLAAVPLVTHSYVLSISVDSKWIGFSQGVLLSLIAGGVAWASGRRVALRSERLLAWQADQERLRLEASHHERLSLARELHDGVANTITTVLLQAAAARSAGVTDPGALRGIESAARRAMEEIQTTLGLMPREPLAAGGPQLADLPALLALAAETGLAVDFVETGRRVELAPEAQTAIYRAIQEGITNTLKYAPSGTRCRIALAWSADELRVDIADFPARAGDTLPALPPTGGRGLTGLRDRLGRLGGALETEADDDGYRLAARLPVGVR
ncbi:histidine kinase [Micropruina sp.]|uniref:sensor histidine kinase n=1 Tax=Micropruina sp. TaxID=2737536 RepID=UPI00261548A2|nr:histidine kinase [Micropruina sp.]